MVKLVIENDVCCLNLRKFFVRTEVYVVILVTLEIPSDPPSRRRCITVGESKIYWSAFSISYHSAGEHRDEMMLNKTHSVVWSMFFCYFPVSNFLQQDFHSVLGEEDFQQNNTHRVLFVPHKSKILWLEQHYSTCRDILKKYFKKL